MSRNWHYVETDAQLGSSCASLQLTDCIAFDTEFVRVTTFYPLVGLLQLNSGQTSYLIDPIHIVKWDDLHLLFDEKEFIFHACGEDIELLKHFFNNVPKRIFDTQIGAFFLGASNGVSYSALVEQYCHLSLDKTQKRTDWLARPLNQQQCQYALNDVIYLSEVAIKMKAELYDRNWLDAAYEECQDLVNYRCRLKSAENSYLTIKKTYHLTPGQLAYLKALSAWRFETAQTTNKALNFVLTEETLINLAKYHPTSFADYARCGIYGKNIKKYGAAISAILKQSLEPIELVKPIEKTKEYKQLFMILKEQALQVSEVTGLDPSFLVQKRHVIDFIRWQKGDKSVQPVFLFGWRAPFFSSLFAKNEINEANC